MQTYTNTPDNTPASKKARVFVDCVLVPEGTVYYAPFKRHLRTEVAFDGPFLRDHWETKFKDGKIPALMEQVAAEALRQFSSKTIDITPKSERLSKMNQLITITESQWTDGAVQTVNARELHEHLESKQDYSTWIKARIKKFEFVKGKDYVLTFHKIGERQNVTTHEYHLTLDMAKELAMVENNEKGRQARRYFIEAEKELRKPAEIDMTKPENLIALAQSQIERANKAEAKIEEMRPAVAALERIEGSEGLLTLREAAKVLGWMQRRFIAKLQEMSWIYKNPGQKNWQGYSAKVKAGYVDHKTYTYTGSEGVEKTDCRVVLTPKGISRLAKLFGTDELHLAA